MSCEKMDERLNDYLDDLLPATGREEVDRHLRECAGCRDSLREMRALVREATSLPRTIEPPRDLWRGIEQDLLRVGRIARESSTRRQGVGPFSAWLPGLAAAALIIVVTAGVTLLLTRGNRDGRSAARGGMTGISAATLASYREAESVYLAATDDLLILLEDRRGELAPETLAVIESNLRIINDSIQEVRVALEEDPKSSQNRDLFTSLHWKKIMLLQQAVRLPPQS